MSHASCISCDAACWLLPPAVEAHRVPGGLDALHVEEKTGKLSRRRVVRSGNTARFPLLVKKTAPVDRFGKVLVVGNICWSGRASGVLIVGAYVNAFHSPLACGGDAHKIRPKGQAERHQVKRTAEQNGTAEKRAERKGPYRLFFI